MISKVILDTNVFVAAGFNRKSSSYKLIEMVREGALVMMWNAKTKKETKRIVSKIPPLNWSEFEELFVKQHEYMGVTDESKYEFIKDKDDRKFASLAEATRAEIVTNDDHLLSAKNELKCKVYKPSELLQTKY